MATPQTGIFSLGDAAHIYLEFTRTPDTDAVSIVRSIVEFSESRKTVDAANIVIGFRPDLWRTVAADATPSVLSGFDAPLAGAGGYVMPATQADLWLWVAGSSYDNVFDVAREAIARLTGVAALERELGGWTYRHSRDLTGFEDGTENPALMIAPAMRPFPTRSRGPAAACYSFSSGATGSPIGTRCPRRRKSA